VNIVVARWIGTCNIATATADRGKQRQIHRLLWSGNHMGAFIPMSEKTATGTDGANETRPERDGQARGHSIDDSEAKVLRQIEKALELLQSCKTAPAQQAMTILELTGDVLRGDADRTATTAGPGIPICMNWEPEQKRRCTENQPSSWNPDPSRRRAGRFKDDVSEVRLSFDLQAEVVDESRTGIGLLVSGEMRLLPGQTVSVVYRGSPMTAVVKWASPACRSAAQRVGLEWR
jgi:hypothetical protein